MEKGNTKQFSKFQILRTAVYCPILMIVIALIISWKKGEDIEVLRINAQAWLLGNYAILEMILIICPLLLITKL